MMNVSLSRGWDLEVERGPDWLFVRPRACREGAPLAPFSAQQIWALLEQCFSHRLMLELDDIDELDSHWVDQLLWLQQQIESRDGLLRICGLSAENRELLDRCHLEGRLAHYRDRTEAVMGLSSPQSTAPNHPR